MSWSAAHLKSKKSVPRNRRARSAPYDLDSDVFTLDLEKGYQALNLNNTRLILGRKQAVYLENEEFSGMGPADTNFNSLTPSAAALKVTYRYIRHQSHPCNELHWENCSCLKTFLWNYNFTLNLFYGCVRQGSEKRKSHVRELFFPPKSHTFIRGMTYMMYCYSKIWKCWFDMFIIYIFYL